VLLGRLLDKILLWLKDVKLVNDGCLELAGLAWAGRPACGRSTDKGDNSDNPQTDGQPDKPGQAPLWKLAFSVLLSLEFSPYEAPWTSIIFMPSQLLPATITCLVITPIAPLLCHGYE